MYKEYILNTRKTAIYPEACTGGTGELMYLALGLGGEINQELIKELQYDLLDDPDFNSLFKELGDCSYYLFRLCDALNIELKPPADKFNFIKPSEHQFITQLSVNAGVILNLVKKVYRDNLNLHVECKERTKVKDALQNLLSLFQGCSNFYGKEYSEVLSDNTKKLLDRLNRGVIQGSGDNR